MDFLTLFNEVAKVASPLYADKRQVSSVTEPLAQSELDSLDIVMVCVYLSDLYGIPEATAKNMPVGTVAEIHNFILKHKSTEPESIEEAIRRIK